jgi:hypothetical protein
VPIEPGSAHERHWPHVEWEQQTPSVQLPDAHSFALTHFCPSALPQEPPEPQVELPLQVSSSAALTTTEQAPI